MKLSAHLDTEANRKLVEKLVAMRGGVSPSGIEKVLPVVEQIRELKKQHNAVVLSHYYMSPVLQVLEKDGGIADFVGDSLGLSVEATKVEADYIIFCGVKFMAETAHILNPSKKVLLPNHDAGCTLASSITGADVRNLRAQYPGVPVIAYINTYAETKAEVDICCTSRNALKIARSFDSDKLIFLPDMYMGQNLQEAFKGQTNKELILWNGKCEVHEQFTENISEMAEVYPEAEMLLHWEVPGTTVSKMLGAKNGLVGSTSDIISYAGSSAAKQFILGSECDLGATLKGIYPEKEFITPCVVCNFMKKINIRNTLDSLLSIGTQKEDNYIITLADEIREKAFLPVKRMLEIQ